MFDIAKYFYHSTLKYMNFFMLLSVFLSRSFVYVVPLIFSQKLIIVVKRFNIFFNTAFQLAEDFRFEIKGRSGETDDTLLRSVYMSLEGQKREINGDVTLTFNIVFYPFRMMK